MTKKMTKRQSRYPAMVNLIPKGGYIALFRKFRDNFLWKENRPKTKAEAWLDLCMEARFKHDPGIVVIGMITLECQYGECLRSMESWAKRWDWSKPKVKRFFNLLQDCSMIVFKSERITTRITICNYGVYDMGRNANDPQTIRKRSANDPQTNTTNKDKKDNNGKNGNKGVSAGIISDFHFKANPSVTAPTTRRKFEKAIENGKITLAQLLDAVDGDIAPGTEPWDLIKQLEGKKPQPESKSTHIPTEEENDANRRQAYLDGNYPEYKTEYEAWRTKQGKEE